MNPTWFAIAASVIGGGAVGAVITALVTRHRNKRQPVSFRKERIEVFRHSPDTPFLQAALTLTTEEAHGVHSSVPIKNLSIEQITLRNTGNTDISEFKFGITLQNDNQAIKVQSDSPDRHHIVTVQQEVSLESPQNVVDFILQPFNREDEYKFTIHFIYRASAKPIQLSSPHSTKLVEGKDRAGSKFANIFSMDSLFHLAGLVFAIAGVIVVVFTLALAYFSQKSSNSSGDLLLTPSDVIRREQDQKLQQQIDGLNKKFEKILEQQSVSPTPNPTPSLNK